MSRVNNKQFLVNAYQCDICDFLSTSQKEFGTHRKEHIKEEAAIAKESARIAELNAKRDWFRLNLTNVNDITSVFKTHMAVFGWEYSELNINLGFSREVSASHGAPIGCQTNWDGRKPWPKSYPGWRGSISGKIDKKPLGDNHSFFSDKISHCCNGFHTGTGGGGDKFHYEAYIFAQDFPHLAPIIKIYEDLSQKHDELSKLVTIEQTWASKFKNAFCAPAIKKYQAQDPVHKKLKMELDKAIHNTDIARAALQAREHKISKLLGEPQVSACFLQHQDELHNVRSEISSLGLPIGNSR